MEKVEVECTETYVCLAMSLLNKSGSTVKSDSTEGDGNAAILADHKCGKCLYTVCGAHDFECA